jgi:pSer/pThr/pTyr-binding forkhead associated (FHA) protein
MRVTLEAIAGPVQGKQIIAEMGQIVSVGRTKKANVALGDTFLSGVHFAIECRKGDCYVRDLKSRNGTKLNGKLITEAVLKDGDRLNAGHTEFVVRLEGAPRDVTAAGTASAGPASEVVTAKPPRKVSQKLKPPAARETRAVEQKPAATPQPSPVETKAPPSAKPAPPAVPLPPTESVAPQPLAAEVIASAAFDSYQAATPEGRLLHILSTQPQPLMALIDAVHDRRILELLGTHGEENQSLYDRGLNPTMAPHLVRLPPRSQLLKQMIQKGWGHGWGVYLTCPLSLSELRQYFRTALMVSLPDGAELFSRFYDPRFFRRFLETCTGAEAEKFFGPVTAYFMEDQRPEILLEFARDNNGVKKRGHLLSDLL